MTDPIPAEAYQALVEESLVGVYLIQDGRLLYVNRKLAALFGYSREEMMALPSLLDVIAEPDRETVRERLRQRISGEIREIEYNVQGIRKDGQIIHLDVRSARTLHEGRPAVMGSMVDITARKQLEESLRNLSLVDELTGLYNRRGFTTLAEGHLILALRKRRPLLLISADVDDLKGINDRYGHAAGDQALVAAAALLRSTYRSADIIARLGGDEFTVFPLEAADESATVLLERLQGNLRDVQRPASVGYQLSMSAGMARLDPHRCTNVEALLVEADRELYQQKRQRRARREL